MKIVDCEQGTPTWAKYRLGLPTGSQVHRLITPKTLEASAQAEGYRNQLIAEWLLGYQLEDGTSGWMERGTEMEEEARTWYEFDRDVTVERVGFVLNDDESFGGSPDGLVGDDGVWEAKCPAAHTHVGYVIEPQKLADKYFGQVQAYMMLTGRQWCDLTSYSPDLPCVVHRIPRDELYITALQRVVGVFSAHLNQVKAKLREHKKTSILDYVNAA